MVSAKDSGSNGPGSSPDRGYCVMCLIKTVRSARFVAIPILDFRS